MPQLFAGDTFANTLSREVRSPDPDTLGTRVNEFFASLGTGSAIRSLDIHCAGDGASWLANVTYVPAADATAADIVVDSAVCETRGASDASTAIEGKIADAYLAIQAAFPTDQILIRETLVAGGGAGRVWCVGVLAELA